MILEIRLGNFFSIKDEVVLNLRAGNSQSRKVRELENNVFKYEDDNVLKAVALYGANASGKTNIIKAIRFCCRMVTQSHTHNENAIFNFMPFKFEGYPEKQSSFLINFVINGIEYEYSFTLTRLKILKEKERKYSQGMRTSMAKRKINTHLEMV
jgi:AAA15 family ATPase/GTPase